MDYKLICSHYSSNNGQMSIQVVELIKKMSNKNKKHNLAWGELVSEGVELEALPPIFTKSKLDLSQKVNLLTRPKRFFTYINLHQKIKKNPDQDRRDPFRILEVNCNLGSRLIDIKRMFNRKIELIGTEQVRLKADIAQKRAREHGVNVETEFIENNKFSFPSGYFDFAIKLQKKDSAQEVNIGEINKVLSSKGNLILYSQTENVEDKLISNGFNVLRSYHLLSRQQKHPSLLRGLLDILGNYTINKFFADSRKIIVAQKRRDAFG